MNTNSIWVWDGDAASQRVAALAAFNVGIDIAQTAVVLIVIGALWVSGRVLAERTTWVRVAAATGAAVFGLVWTATRLLEISALPRPGEVVSSRHR